MKKFELEGATWFRTVLELHQEWRKIALSTCFNRSFLAWAQDIPEIGPLKRPFPSSAWLFSVLQFVKLEVDKRVAQDFLLEKKNLQSKKKCDEKYLGAKQAFASVRGPAMPPVSQVRESRCHRCVVALAAKLNVRGTLQPNQSDVFSQTSWALTLA